MRKRRNLIKPTGFYAYATTGNHFILFYVVVKCNDIKMQELGRVDILKTYKMTDRVTIFVVVLAFVHLPGWVVGDICAIKED